MRQLLSFNLVAIGLRDLDHAIERSALDEQFHRLIVELARTHAAAKDRLEAKHRGFSTAFGALHV
jgi:hypothetical protein